MPIKPVMSDIIKIPESTFEPIPKPTKPIEHSVCTEQLCQEGLALIQTATLYDCGVIRYTDVIDGIDSVTKILAYWRKKLAIGLEYPQK